MKTGATVFVCLALSACLGDAPSGPWPPLRDADLPWQAHVPRWPSEVITGSAAGDRLLVADDYGVFRSDDGGSNWTRLERPDDERIVELVITADGSELVAVTRNGSVHRSSDGGTSWTKTSIYPSLPLDMDLLARSWEGYGLRNATISADLNNWLLVGFCEGFVTRDGGNSWDRVTGNEELGSWDHDDRCLSELIVDEDFEPRFASVEITGRLGSGEYVFARNDDGWEELCSFDTVAFLLESVVECGEVDRVKSNARLFAQSDIYAGAWGDESDPEAAVFEQHRLVIKTGLDLGLLSNLIENERGDIWFVSYLGVARSTDRGRHWTTLIGGMPGAERQARLDDREFVALWDNRIYRSANERVWQAEPAVHYVYDFAALEGGALVATGGQVIRLGPGGVMDPALKRQTYRLHAAAGVIWAMGRGFVASSTDQGHSFKAADTDADSSVWLCDRICLALDDWGNVWEATPGQAGTTVTKVASLSRELGEDQYLNGQWAADDLSLLVVGIDDDIIEQKKLWTSNDVGRSQKKLWTSNDLGRSWQPLPTPVRYIDHVVFPGSGTAFLEGDGKAHWIRRGGALMVSQRSPVPTDAGVACSPGPGQIVLETWDIHPKWPDEEDEYIVYTQDMGKSWWTMRTSRTVCPAD